MAGMAEDTPTSEAPPPPAEVNSEPLEELDQDALLTKLLEQNRLVDCELPLPAERVEG